jgi:hypothetical protein
LVRLELINEELMKKAVAFVLDNMKMRGVKFEKDEFFQVLNRTYERYVDPSKG